MLRMVPLPTRFARREDYSGPASPAKNPPMSQATRILAALAVGLLLGILTARAAFAPQAIAIADPIGGLWLDALRMTIVPLIVALLINGITASAEAARSGRLAGRTVILFIDRAVDRRRSSRPSSRPSSSSSSR